MKNGTTSTWEAKTTWWQQLFKVSHHCNSPGAVRKRCWHGIQCCREHLVGWQVVKKILMLLRSSHIGLDHTGKFQLVELHTTVLKVRSLMRYHKKVKCIKRKKKKGKPRQNETNQTNQTKIHQISLPHTQHLGRQGQLLYWLSSTSSNKVIRNQMPSQVSPLNATPVPCFQSAKQ